MSRNRNIAIVAAAGLLILSACGSTSKPLSSKDNPNAPKNLTLGDSRQSSPSEAPNPFTPKITGINTTALNKLVGTYDGFFYVNPLNGGEWLEQKYSLVFGKSQQGNETYGFVKFTSSGQLGSNVDFESYLMMDSGGEPINDGSHILYKFHTSKAISRKEIYPNDISLVLLLALKASDGSFDPTQSWIYFYGCEFVTSGTIAMGCSRNIDEDVWFGASVSKR